VSPKTTLVSVDDVAGVRSIGLARPEVHNALNQQVIMELLHALSHRPRDTRCVILYGHGSSFCAGGDRREGIAGPTGAGTDALEALQEITRLLQSPDVVTIAAVEGWAIGGGAELAVACDVIVAAEGACFRFPEVELDAHATGGSTWLLPRAIGTHRAHYLLLTGRTLPAAQARDWGLVTELTSDGAALGRSRQLAREITEFPVDSVRTLKRSLHDALAGTLEEALVNEAQQAQDRLVAGGFLGEDATNPSNG
jgi:crotonobetaine/carnitine-CoA ligase